MRKYLYLAMAAASAAVMVAPIVAEAAPAASTHVLTIRKAHGTAVKPRAVLKASLAKGTSAVFSLSGGLTATITCKQASFAAAVVRNPTAPGKATETIKSETIGKCTVNFPGATIKKVKALNLPYNSTVRSKKGHPVTVSGRTKAKPIAMTSTVVVSNTPITCTYEAASIAGSASNKHNTITIVKQKFTKAAGSNAACPTNATFSATFGPVRDSSVKGNPVVFVN